MSITIKDIAREAKVSYTTVSRALSDHPEISGETKRKILKLAKEMGYFPNAMAKGLVTKSSHTLGLIVPDITNPFISEIARGIEDYANRNGYQVFLCNSNWSVEREKEYITKLYGSRVDGIVFTPVSDDISHITDTLMKVPVVFSAYRPHIKGCSFVVIDDFKAATLAMEYLVKLGHRKIAFISGLAGCNSTLARFSAFESVMEKYSIPMNPAYIVYGQFTISSGYELTKGMLENMELPTAILAGNDIVALGVIQAIEEFGLEVPKDISVLGFDDIAYASLHKIQLTTVYQPQYKIGELSAEILIEKIQNPNSKEQHIKILEPRLIIRKTCKGI